MVTEKGQSSHGEYEQIEVAIKSHKAKRLLLLTTLYYGND